ncbi:MAG: PEP/pyruvate-binding domain-containing protein [Candidatus Gracilibacteria bacterium]
MGILKLLASSELDQFRSEIGGKTMSLKRLQDAGLNVPDFRAIPSSVITSLVDENGKWNDTFLTKLAQKITDEFPKPLYAIRSSALIEDTSAHSYAGQFKTEIHQSGEQLADAIKSVVQHAHILLKKDLTQFSLIIQEYIEADYSGITFTRNPLGGRELVIEYHKGIGEDIVSGAVKPKRYSLHWNQMPDNILPEIHSALGTFKKIEQLSEFPQDIEWCIRDDVWYFLQSRPITTLTKNDYEQSIYLDDYFKDRSEYILEKTEISEIAPRPTPVTLDILHRIYAAGGPVKRVYRKHGIIYKPIKFLEVIGNELFVNREQEIATLLPSYSYFGDMNYKPKFMRIRGAWRTLFNMIQLQRISVETPSKILEKLTHAFTSDMTTVDAFMVNYELIFEINLLAQKALSKLQFATQKESLSSASMLSLTFENDAPANLPDGIIDEKSLQGNALEIADTSPFVAANFSAQEAPEARNWYDELPDWKKKYFTPIIQMAKVYSALREYGRWLTVAHISGIRKTLPQSDMNEWDGKDEYLRYNKFHFPARLTDRYIQENRELQGVSAGTATGVLVDREYLLKNPSEKNTDTSSAPPTQLSNIILYTKILSPDLTEYFGAIKGIISEDGGLLSHLAIMARESGIPVIVGASLTKEQIQLGDMVEINGSTGKIQKIDSKAAKL